MANNQLDWLSELKSKFNARVAHVFILHNNVFDIVDSNQALRLDQCLRKHFPDYDMIPFYNISAGLTFPDETMKEVFKTAIGLKRDRKLRFGEERILAKVPNLRKVSNLNLMRCEI